MGWTENAVSALRGWKRFTREIEGTLTDNIAGLVPWLAPVIPAWIAWEGMTGVLHFSDALALVGAMVVEFLGFSAITTAIQFWEYNQEKRKVDQQAPVVLAGLAVVFYLAVILTVNVLLDPAGPVNKLAKGLLSSLSLVGAMILALRSQHSRRLTEIEKERSYRREDRKLRLLGQDRQLMDISGSSPVRSSNIDWRNLPPDDRLQIGEMSTVQIMERYNVSDRTARNWRSNALERIGNRNGHNNGSAS